MFDWLLIALTVLSAVIVAKLILKKYNAIFVFFASGLVILMVASVLTGTPILGKATLGNVVLDAFGFITKTFKSSIAGIGSLIMVVTGYATYMKHTQASTKLAYMATMHLGGIRNKYLILAAFYLVGMALKLVLTSQASLAVLMLATVFPVLMALGIRPITGASVLALLCLDYGPNDGSSLFMSTVAKLNPVEMFLHYQARVALCIILVTAVLIPLYYHYMDKKDAEESHGPVQAPEPVPNPPVPGFYVLLPLIPLIIVFADYFIPSTKIDVITANFIGFAITFIIEFIRRSDRAAIPQDMAVILKGMANVFVSVVSIIISASVFAQGIKILGGITIFTNWISGMQGAVLLIMIILTVITRRRPVLRLRAPDPGHRRQTRRTDHDHFAAYGARYIHRPRVVPRLRRPHRHRRYGRPRTHCAGQTDRAPAVYHARRQYCGIVFLHDDVTPCPAVNVIVRRI